MFFTFDMFLVKQRSVLTSIKGCGYSTTVLAVAICSIVILQGMTQTFKLTCNYYSFNTTLYLTYDNVCLRFHRLTLIILLFRLFWRPKCGTNL